MGAVARMSSYQKMSIVEKRAVALSSVREASVTCPDCDTQVMPVDLLAHRSDRCPGRREPGPSARWVTWREALAMGVPAMTLSRWASNGHVRVVGTRMDRKYLHRDLALKISQRLGFRRR